MLPSGGVNYEKLEEVMKTTLAALEHLTIEPSSIDLDRAAAYVAGGFGDVHSATLRGPTRRRVAVKMLRPAGNKNQRLRVAAALAREIKVWSAVEHKNILPLIAFHFDDVALDCAWTVTEWHEYGNVLSYIEATNPDEEERLQLAKDTASGLAYLHTLSPPVCHGDIKAENTLVNAARRALLCDFGLSRALEEIPSGLTTTTPHTGTTRYASPELLIDDEPRHTLKSDVWAWGCLLLVIVTGLRPYQTIHLGMNVMHSIIQGDLPVDLSTVHVDADMKDLFLRCWESTADLRPWMHWCLHRLCARDINMAHELGHPGFSNQPPLRGAETSSPPSPLPLHRHFRQPSIQPVSIMAPFPGFGSSGPQSSTPQSLPSFIASAHHVLPHDQGTFTSAETPERQRAPWHRRQRAWEDSWNGMMDGPPPPPSFRSPTPSNANGSPPSYNSDYGPPPLRHDLPAPSHSSSRRVPSENVPRGEHTDRQETRSPHQGSYWPGQQQQSHPTSPTSQRSEPRFDEPPRPGEPGWNREPHPPPLQHRPPVEHPSEIHADQSCHATWDISVSKGGKGTPTPAPVDVPQAQPFKALSKQPSSSSSSSTQISYRLNGSVDEDYDEEEREEHNGASSGSTDRAGSRADSRPSLPLPSAFHDSQSASEGIQSPLNGPSNEPHRGPVDRVQTPPVARTGTPLKRGAADEHDEVVDPKRVRFDRGGSSSPTGSHPGPGHIQSPSKSARGPAFTKSRRAVVDSRPDRKGR